MSKQLTTEEFVRKATEKHGTTYDYQHSVYADQHTKVEIVCREHGAFYMLPANHYWKGQRCPKCAEISRRSNKTKSHEAFVEAAQNVHGALYEYPTPYASQHTKVGILCKKHGVFYMKPNAHVSGRQGCPRCAGKHKTHEEWMHEFVLVHGHRYDYSNSIIETSHEKVNISCSKHGTFGQTPAMHKLGQGCPLCAHDGHKGRYSEVFFERRPNLSSTPAFLYILGVSDATEHFIKVGITATTVEQRIRNMHAPEYSVALLEKYQLPLESAFKLEQIILDRLHKHRYTPSKSFHGQTECLDAECQESVIKIIQGALNK